MTMTSARTLGLLAVVASALPIVVATPAPASAASCPDVEIVFARGTDEPAGVGAVGQAFVDALGSRVGSRSVGVYAVNYPASNDIAASAAAGGADATEHVSSTAASCPNTRMVLGGHSQGASVIELATNALAPGVGDHVAADALFGTPRSTFAALLYKAPMPVTAPAFVDRTIDQCVPNDPVCWQGGFNLAAHTAYVETGMVDQAADFVAGRL